MSEPAYQVRINEQRCIGCCLCEENAPDVFAMGDYTAYVKRTEVGYEEREPVRVAARDCPVNAISLLPTSGHFAHYDDQEREDEEKCGEIGKYKREHRDSPDCNDIQTHNAQ